MAATAPITHFQTARPEDRTTWRANPKPAKTSLPEAPPLPKAPTGIQGLDEITGGGLPRGRPTLVCGSAGSRQDDAGRGVPRARRACEFGEPGVFMMFEENAEELAQNLRSLGFDLDKLQQQKKIVGRPRPHRAQRDRGDRRVRPRGPVHPPGPRDRLASARSAWCSTPSRRCSRGLPNHAVLRAELRRLFRWLKDRGVTAVITGERGEAVADALRPGGVRGRLRDPARPPHRRPGVHAPAARGQVSRHGARHQRIPVPDRRATASRCCRSRRCGSTTRPRPSACPPASPGWTTCSAARASVPRQQHRWSPARRAPARAASARSFVDAACRARRARAAVRLRGVVAARCCATCARSASTSGRG